MLSENVKEAIYSNKKSLFPGYNFGELFLRNLDKLFIDVHVRLHEVST